MKKQIFPIISVLLFVCYLTSCSVPAVSNETVNYDGNTIGIQVKLPGGVSKAVFGPDDAALYKIEMSLDEAVVQSKTGAPGDTIILKVDKEGKYVVTVSAYNVDNTEIAKGSVTADLKFGKGIIPLQIKIKGYQKIIEIQPEIIWETDDENTMYDYLFEGPDITQTEHVKVEKVSDGLKFIITRPKEDYFNPNALLSEEDVVDSAGNPLFFYQYVGEDKGDYDADYIYVGEGKGSYIRSHYTSRVYGGFGYVGIYRYEKIDGKYYWTTCAELNCYDTETDVFECVYPLVEPGKKTVFVVLMDPSNVYEYSDHRKYEYISVVPENGIGGLDYSEFRSGAKASLSYDGEKPIVSVTGYNIELPEYVENVQTRYDVNIGSIDYSTKYATKWLTFYNGNDGIEYNISKDPYFESLKNSYNYTLDENGNQIQTPLTEEQIEESYRTNNFKAQLESSDKDQFYIEWFLVFKLSENLNLDDNVMSWRTGSVQSNFVKFR